jgi:hypothetical protein
LESAFYSSKLGRLALKNQKVTIIKAFYNRFTS